MYYRILIFLFFLFSCTPNQLNVKTSNNQINNVYSNIGFALIYNEDLKKKKL